MEVRPKEWKCEACQHVGPTEEFGDKNHQCPECGSEDSFPSWRIQCIKCKKVYELAKLFSEAELDLDPRPWLQSREELRMFDGCPTVLDEKSPHWLSKVCGNKLFQLVEFDRV